MDIKRIISTVLGKRYYAVVVYRTGTDKTELTSGIYRSMEDALRHAAEISASCLSFTVAGVVTFRSHLPL